MNGKKDISVLNIRVTIKQWRFVQDNAGGTYTEEVNSYDVWANKKNRSGSQEAVESQQQWNYETTFTVRYNPLFKSNFTVDHGAQRWVINSIEIVDEASKAFMKLRCSLTDIGLNIS